MGVGRDCVPPPSLFFLGLWSVEGLMDLMSDEFYGMSDGRSCAICGDSLEEYEDGDVCWDCQNLMISSPVTNPEAGEDAGRGLGKRPYL